jgi:aryl-alcohol dehydrogenase-like predicted oxidoreductase
VARGLFAGRIRDASDLAAGDIRLDMPRFQGEALGANLKLYARFAALAGEAGCTPAQLCLAWLLTKGDNVVPIPGTTQPEHMLENAAAADIRLSAETMAKVDDIVNERTVTGRRYSPEAQRAIDTEG